MHFVAIEPKKVYSNFKDLIMKKITLIIIAFLLTITANAQTIKKYSGEMSKPEWIEDLLEYGADYFNGFYSYYEDKDEKRVNHGAFQVNYKTGVVNGVHHYEISGSYIHGKRNGKWLMRAKLLNGRYASNYNYLFNYINGILNGPFQIYYPGNKDVELLGQFSNGTIAGKVIIKHHMWLSKGYIQYEGRINSKGNPHGIWTEKHLYEKAIPKDITRFYYDGNLVYRREKDLSSGKLEYTQIISDKIKNPADSVLITDTVINGHNFINVGGCICRKDDKKSSGRFSDDEESSDLYSIVCNSGIERFYHKIKNWQTYFDTEYYPTMVKKEQEEQQRRIKERKQEERRKKEAEERRLREEEQRKKQEAEAKLNAEIEAVWNTNSPYYEFCWGRFDAKSNFKKLYKEIGLDSINAMLDSIGRYEYENYTVEELFTNNPDYHYYVFNVFLSDIKGKKKKKLNKIFKSYDAYIECKKKGESSIQTKIK